MAAVEFNRDPTVRANVQFVVLTKQGRLVVDVASTAMPGQPLQAIWKSGMVDGIR